MLSIRAPASRTGLSGGNLEAERRRCEQARQSFEREEAAMAKEREALRRARKKCEQASAECDCPRTIQLVGWHQSRRFVRWRTSPLPVSASSNNKTAASKTDERAQSHRLRSLPLTLLRGPIQRLRQLVTSIAEVLFVIMLHITMVRKTNRSDFQPKTSSGRNVSF